MELASKYDPQDVEGNGISTGSTTNSSARSQTVVTPIQW